MSYIQVSDLGWSYSGLRIHSLNKTLSVQLHFVWFKTCHHLDPLVVADEVDLTQWNISNITQDKMENDSPQIVMSMVSLCSVRKDYF